MAHPYHKEYQEWFRSLNVGDKVAARCSYGFDKDAIFYKTLTIARISDKRIKFDFEDGTTIRGKMLGCLVPISAHTEQANIKKRIGEKLYDLKVVLVTLDLYNPPINNWGSVEQTCNTLLALLEKKEEKR